MKLGPLKMEIEVSRDRRALAARRHPPGLARVAAPTATAADDHG
jgi:hypothetical protein